jgi:hypothetical protein
MTKAFISFVLALSLAGCKDTQSSAENKPLLPAAQTRLMRMAAHYKEEYQQAKGSEKDSVTKRYMEGLYESMLLEHLDSFHVFLKSKIIEDRKITTVFQCGEDIEFKYGMTFTDSLTPKQDSLYRGMRDMKPQTEIVVNFMHMGSYQIVSPPAPGQSVFRIFAVPAPAPLSWTK